MYIMYMYIYVYMYIYIYIYDNTTMSELPPGLDRKSSSSIPDVPRYDTVYRWISYYYSTTIYYYYYYYYY